MKMKMKTVDAHHTKPWPPPQHIENKKKIFFDGRRGRTLILMISVPLCVLRHKILEWAWSTCNTFCTGNFLNRKAILSSVRTLEDLQFQEGFANRIAIEKFPVQKRCEVGHALSLSQMPNGVVASQTARK